MIYPSADKIEANVESKYELVILAAKRCRQIREGSRARVETDSENPLTIALEEIAAGVIKGREDKSSLAGQEAEADRQAVVGARELDVEVDEFLPDAELARAAAALGADALYAPQSSQTAWRLLPQPTNLAAYRSFLCGRSRL